MQESPKTHSIMSTTEARKRAAILVLTIAFGLTCSLWISYERTMKASAAIKSGSSPAQRKESSKTNLIALNRYEHFERPVMNLRPHNYLLQQNRVGLEKEEPAFDRNRDLTDGVGLRLSNGSSALDNNSKIAFVDFNQITISYQKKNGSLPTNNLTEWKNFISEVQMVISNRAVADGYNLVIDKSPLTRNAVPAYYYIGEIPDITAKVIADLNTSHRQSASVP